MSLTYLIWSDQGHRVTDRHHTASVPKEEGGRETVSFTVMTDNPGSIKYDDKIVMWRGARHEIQQILTHQSSSRTNLPCVFGPYRRFSIP